MTRTLARRRWAGPHRSFTLATTATGVAYHTRWWLFDTPWGGLAVHRYTGPNTCETLHDHPFPFVSLILRGGYTEARRDPITGRVDTRHVRRVNVVRPSDAHTITALDRPRVWTLVFAGADRRVWGFWTPTDDRRRWEWTRNDAFDHGQYVA